MKYITIDGDDIGQRITSHYLNNDLHSLSKMNDLVNNKTNLIAEFLKKRGFTIIFCAADGVTGYHQDEVKDDDLIFKSINNIAGDEITFSIGIGDTLRNSYIALLSAKGSGKACLRNFENM